MLSGDGTLLNTTITTDKASYQPNDNVSISDGVTNITKNSVQTNLTVNTTIVDANAVVFVIALVHFPEGFHQLQRACAHIMRRVR